MFDARKLNTETFMPRIGLGTADPMHEVHPPKWAQQPGPFLRLLRAVYRRVVYKMRRKWGGLKLSLSVRNAIHCGYRMIDTSAAYQNEHLIRRGIRWSGVPRKELFIITRVSNQQQWAGDVRGSLLKSLEALGTDYVDLYMFHWPVPDVYIKTWKEMETLHKEGLVKSIGVANCHQHHLEALLAEASVVPAVNEFEIHPLMSQEPLVAFCRAKEIEVIGYTPIGRYHEKLVNSPVLTKIAMKYGKSIPQIILRWHFQRGITTIPRSTKTRHIKSNIAIFDFELTVDEMRQIDGMNENLRLRYDPDNCDFTKL